MMTFQEDALARVLCAIVSGIAALSAGVETIPAALRDARYPTGRQRNQYREQILRASHAMLGAVVCRRLER